MPFEGAGAPGYRVLSRASAQAPGAIEWALIGSATSHCQRIFSTSRAAPAVLQQAPHSRPNAGTRIDVFLGRDGAIALQQDSVATYSALLAPPHRYTRPLCVQACQHICLSAWQKVHIHSLFLRPTTRPPLSPLSPLRLGVRPSSWLSSRCTFL